MYAYGHIDQMAPSFCKTPRCASPFLLMLLLVLRAACQCELDYYQDISELGAGDRMGTAVDMTLGQDLAAEYGDWLVGGAPDSRVNSKSVGKVYVYPSEAFRPGAPEPVAINPWITDPAVRQEIQLCSGGTNNDKDSVCGPNGNFGWDVSISPDARFIIIGNPVNKFSTGDSQAYVVEQDVSTPFPASSWGTPVQLQKPPGASSDWGSSVDIHQNIAVVGDYGAELVAVYIFDEDQDLWGPPQVLLGSDFGALPDADFGYEVALQDLDVGGVTRLAIGAPTDCALEQAVECSDGSVLGNEATGRVYVFERPTAGGAFALATTVEPAEADLTTVQRFGHSIDYSSSRLVVGAPGELSNNLPGSGYAFLYNIVGDQYVFIRAAGEENPNPQSFGWSVSIHDSTSSVASGAPRRKGTFGSNKANVGAAYVYKSPDGCFLGDSCSTTAVAQERLGYDMSLIDQYLAVGGPRGEPGTTGGNSAVGTIHFYNVRPLLDLQLRVDPINTGDTYQCTGGLAYDIACHGGSKTVTTTVYGPRRATSDAVGVWRSTEGLEIRSTYSSLGNEEVVVTEDLSAGDWTLIVYRGGCISDPVHVVVTQPEPLVLTAVPDCSNVMTMQVTGGCARYDWVVILTDNGGSSTTLTFNNDATQTYDYSSIANRPLTFDITVHDHVHDPPVPDPTCSVSEEVVVEGAFFVGVPQVAQQACGAASYGVSCPLSSDGAAHVSVTRCGSGRVHWAVENRDSGAVEYTSETDGATGSITLEWENAPAGTFAFVIYDSLGPPLGTELARSEDFTVSSPPQLQQPVLSALEYGCGNYQRCAFVADGSISVTFPGGCGPFSYQWTELSSGTVVSNSESILSALLPAESVQYVVRVSDRCTTSEESEALLFDRAQDELTLDYEVLCTSVAGKFDILLTPNGGCGDYSYQWTTEEGSDLSATSTEPDQRDVDAGVYRLVVSDGNGCVLGQIIVVDDFDLPSGDQNFDEYYAVPPIGSAWKTSVGGASVTQTAAEAEDVGSSPFFLVLRDPSIDDSTSRFVYDGFITITDTIDSDFFGLAFGLPDGDFFGATVAVDFLLLDWKGSDETVTGLGTSNAGLRLSRVTAPEHPDPDFYWRHDGSVTELATAGALGSVGWEANRRYHFHVEWTPTLFSVYVDGSPEIQHPLDAAPAGKVALYTYSQTSVLFENFDTDTVVTDVCDSGLASFRKTFTDPCSSTADQLTWSVDWGDGHSEDSTNPDEVTLSFSNGAGVMRGSHNYGVGMFEVRICITRSSTASEYCDTFAVEVSQLYTGSLETPEWAMYIPQKIMWTTPSNPSASNVGIDLERWNGASYLFDKQIVASHPISSGEFIWKPHNVLPGRKRVVIRGLEGDQCVFGGMLETTLSVRPPTRAA